MVNCSLIPKDRKCVKCGSAKTWTRNIGGRSQPVWHRSESDFLCSISMAGSEIKPLNARSVINLSEREYGKNY